MSHEPTNKHTQQKAVPRWHSLPYFTTSGVAPVAPSGNPFYLKICPPLLLPRCCPGPHELLRQRSSVDTMTDRSGWKFGAVVTAGRSSRPGRGHGHQPPAPPRGARQVARPLLPPDHRRPARPAAQHGASQSTRPNAPRPVVKAPPPARPQSAARACLPRRMWLWLQRAPRRSALRTVSRRSVLPGR